MPIGINNLSHAFATIGYELQKACRIWHFSILLIFAAIANNSFGQKTILITDKLSSLEIGKDVYLYEDKTNKVSIEQILKPEFQANFKASSLNAPNYGVTSSTIWTKIEVLNRSSSKDWVLVISMPVLESLKLHYLENGQYKFKKTGKMTLFEDREMRTVDFVFNLPFDKDGKDSVSTYYLETEGRAVVLPLTIGKKDFINHEQQTHALYYIFYLGLVSMLFLHNLAVYITSREREYLYYVLLIFFSIIYFMIIKGYAIYLFPKSIHFLIGYSNIYSSLAGVCIGMFVMTSLHLKRLFPAIIKWFYLTFVGLGFVIIFSLFNDFHTASKLIQPFMLFSVILGMISGIVVYRKGYKFVFFYMLAFGQNFIAMSIFILIFQKVFLYSIYTYNAVVVGICVEMILLAFGLGAKIKSTQKEKLKAQEEAFEMLKENEKIVKEQNDILEIKVKERTRQLELEKKKSDDLLLNILPQDIAEELKETGTTAARLYSNVSVLFTDFVNFTTASELMSPEELVSQIDYCFKGFDRIMDKYGIEKIKTIGDAYLAVCGLPSEDIHHAVKIVNAAKKVCDFMLAYESMRSKENKPFFKIRIGINSGAVVAGIVGIKKYAYDIWGDTVNVAARMEQNSMPGKINISESTHALVKDDFEFTYRGKIDAKNKGLIDMYFLA